jgi:hypothetical protein
MICPKCQQENLESARFCGRCHMTLRFTCPACQHVQSHGNQCERCGVDFAKYISMLQFQMESDVRRERETRRARQNIIRHALLLPVTGGWSLLRSIKSNLSGE